MTEDKSFSSSDHKLQKIWERNEENTSETDNNLIKHQVKFDSKHFSKKIVTIPLIKDLIVPEGEGAGRIRVEFNDFPEFLLNYINIVPIMEVVGDRNDDTVVGFFTSSSQIGDLDPTVGATSTIFKLTGDNYVLKIDLRSLRLRVVTETDAPTPLTIRTELIPFKLNVSLKIINPNIYEKTNIHKE